jgi:hypothetical protein
MFVLLGFAPAYAASWALNKLRMLRVPFEVERVGLDAATQRQVALAVQEVQQAERAAVEVRS